MAKKRYINTKFWDDNYVVGLSSEEKLLFLYFLTNPLTDICGVYEIPISRIAFDTGMNEKLIHSSLTKFSDDNKVHYIDGWIYVQNFAKHQAVNDSVKKGIERSIDLIPESVMAKIRDIETGCRQAVDRLGTSSDLLIPKLIPKPKPSVTANSKNSRTHEEAKKKR